MELSVRAAFAVQNARLYEQAQTAIRLRDDFLLLASHELKTPITPLGLHLQFLQRLLGRGHLESVSPEQLATRVDACIRQLSSLAALIDVLLDTSRIAAGKLHLDRERVDLSKLVSDVVARFSAELASVGSEAATEVTPGLVGCWDRLRLEQVLANLLSNAAKYGAGKPVRIQLRAEGGVARLSVQDFGLGIAEGDQKRIFDRYARAVPVYSIGGFGLGLYIVREIVDAHGGAIRVASEPGRGSTFTVELPLGA